MASDKLFANRYLKLKKVLEIKSWQISVSAYVRICAVIPRLNACNVLNILRYTYAKCIHLISGGPKSAPSMVYPL